MSEKMSAELKQAFATGKEVAVVNKDSLLRVEHVIYGILRMNNIIREILREKVKDYELLVKEVDEFNRTQSENNSEITKDSILNFEAQLQETLQRCTVANRNSGDSLLTPELFFTVAMDLNIAVIKIIKGYGVTKTFLQKKLKQLNVTSSMPFQDEQPKKNSGDNLGKGKTKTPTIDKYCRDLTALANEDKLDPIIGREAEVERVAQILTRRKKNNPVLIGDPGVGKTAIAEGLAIMIAKNECPRTLQGKRLVTLELTSLVAGTKYRGQFEERMQELLIEIRENPNIILFIDELHTLVGAGNSSGALDAANVFKPALARGEMQCIGATTLDEYREHIEKDGALDRRFQKVMVNPPTLAETKEILMNIKSKYEDFHKVEYTEDAIDEIIRLSDRYITNREFPDKAIDILDEAGSRTQVNIKAPEIINKLEAELAEIKKAKLEVVKTQDYEVAADLRDKEMFLTRDLEKANSEWKKKVVNNKMVVDADMICEVVSIMTGIPITRVTQNEIEKLISIDQDIANTVIGQNEAIAKVASAIKRNRTGIRKKHKPIGSFLFIGPSGVGKTELAKVLTKNVFGSEEAMIRIDMSEYSEKFNISKLIGAPPGYVGYNEGGQLTERVKNKPYSLILLDEIEKAHPDVFDILLQVLDEGHLTDGAGRKINFKNTIIIMTSNIGLKQVQNFGTKIGFANEEGDNNVSKEIIEKTIRKFFKTEFLNRLDEIVHFNNLNAENINDIVGLQIAELQERLAESNYKLTISEKAKIELGKLGYSSEYGARELNRTLQKSIEDPMSEELLKNGMPDTGTFDVVFDENDDKFIVTLHQS